MIAADLKVDAPVSGLLLVKGLLSHGISQDYDPASIDMQTYRCLFRMCSAPRADGTWQEFSPFY